MNSEQMLINTNNENEKCLRIIDYGFAAHDEQKMKIIDILYSPFDIDEYIKIIKRNENIDCNIGIDIDKLFCCDTTNEEFDKLLEENNIHSSEINYDINDIRNNYDGIRYFVEKILKIQLPIERQTNIEMPVSLDNIKYNFVNLRRHIYKVYNIKFSEDIRYDFKIHSDFDQCHVKFCDPDNLNPLCKRRVFKWWTMKYAHDCDFTSSYHHNHPLNPSVY